MESKGMDWQEWIGAESLGVERHVLEGSGTAGLACNGNERNVMARKRMAGEARTRTDGNGVAGMDWCGESRSREARFGRERNGRTGM